MITDIKYLFIKLSDTIPLALQKMSDGGEKILLVVDDDQQLKGVLSDGNVRRYILQKGDLKGYVQDCMNPEPHTVFDHVEGDEISHMMAEHKIEVLPVITREGVVIGIHRWCDLFDEAVPVLKKNNIPSVIMAGGKGTRMAPFTRVLPKPLVPIGEQTIIEMILQRFTNYGERKFYISLNHQARLIKAFFEEADLGLDIEFVEEDEPLGTGGALSFLKGKVDGPVFLSNCDIIVDADYTDILDFHKDNNADITIVAAVKHFKVPYGVCQLSPGATLTKIDEKPVFDFFVNTGMYVFESELLNEIPENTQFDFPDLIDKMLNNGGTVVVYLIEENSWFDVGNWEEYHRTTEFYNVQRPFGE